MTIYIVGWCAEDLRINAKVFFDLQAARNYFMEIYRDDIDSGFINEENGDDEDLVARVEAFEKDQNMDDFSYVVDTDAGSAKTFIFPRELGINEQNI